MENDITWTVMDVFTGQPAADGELPLAYLGSSEAFRYRDILNKLDQRRRVAI